MAQLALCSQAGKNGSLWKVVGINHYFLSVGGRLDNFLGYRKRMFFLSLGYA